LSFAQDLVFSERKIRLHRAGEARVIFRFDDHVLDIARRELRRGAEPVALEPQVFDLLVYLVRNRRRVVTKDDLIGGVWGGRIVSDSALTTRLNAARRAVNDSGAEQRVIRTVPRRGVRFIGEVSEEGEPSEADASAAAAEPSAAPRPAPVRRGHSRIRGGHRAADVDQIVGDHAEADPALDAGLTLYRLRFSPCRRLTTLMRPSAPVRHFCPLRNQRFLCSRLRSGLLVERLGMHTRLTLLAFAAASFLAE